METEVCGFELIEMDRNRISVSIFCLAGTKICNNRYLFNGKFQTSITCSNDVKTKQTTQCWKAVCLKMAVVSKIIKSKLK